MTRQAPFAIGGDGDVARWSALPHKPLCTTIWDELRTGAVDSRGRGVHGHT
jgi:hypothetical protein